MPIVEAGLVPGRALAASLAEHPLADLHDQAGLFEQRDEVVGLDDTARGAAPADQRLHSGRAHVLQVERGLVDEVELVVLEAMRRSISSSMRVWIASCMPVSNTT